MWQYFEIVYVYSHLCPRLIPKIADEKIFQTGNGSVNPTAGTHKVSPKVHRNTTSDRITDAPHLNSISPILR